MEVASVEMNVSLRGIALLHLERNLNILNMCNDPKSQSVKCVCSVTHSSSHLFNKYLLRANSVSTVTIWKVGSRWPRVLTL